MSDVYYLDFKKVRKSVLNYIDDFFKKLHYQPSKGAITAVKVHFGEMGNTTYIRPVFIRRIVDNLKKLNLNPFLTDTNTLYHGMRTNSVDFINSAVYNGFGYESMQVPIIIADGLRSNNKRIVETPDSKYYEFVSYGADLYFADEILVVSHVKGHVAAGFGGALKNISMGFATRSTKQQMHGDVKPQINKVKCIGCGLCRKYCPVDAIKIIHDDSVSKKIADFDFEKCIGCADCITVCPSHALKILWNESSERFLEKMGESVYYFCKDLDRKILYFNFLTDITPNCDCMNYSEYPLVPDVGILASFDPVAVDQASVDLINQEQHYFYQGSETEDIHDKFHAFRPHINYEHLIDYCVEKGVGSKKYNLIEL